MVSAMQYRIFWLSLSEMVDAGLPLLQALSIIANQYSDEDRFWRGIKGVIKNIEEGFTLEEAMTESRIFSVAEVSVIKAGEVSGMLDVNIKRIATNQISSRADQYYFFYKMLSGMIGGGVPIRSALKIIIDGLDGPFCATIIKVYDSIIKGNTIAVSMKNSEEFSSFEVSLMDIGEENGCVDLVLANLERLSRPIKFA